LTPVRAACALNRAVRISLLLYREEGVALLEQYTKSTFGCDTQLDTAADEKAIAQICDHIRGMKIATPSGVGKDSGE
jgi:hypothetical protein